MTALSLVALTAFAGACVPDAPPPPPPPPPTPADIALMDDGQLESALAALAPDIRAGAADPDFQADIPPESRGYVDQLIANFATADGRAVVGDQLRASAEGAPRGLPNRAEAIPGGEIGTGAGGTPIIAAVPTPRGTRDPKPPLPARTSVAFNSPSGRCQGPEGDVPAPAAPDAGGELITPQADVFTVGTSGIAVTSPGRILPTGQEPIPGQGPGIVLRGGSFISGAGQQMKIQINLDDPKDFGPEALMPIIRIRPLGATAAGEYEVVPYVDPIRPYVRDARILCYKNDTSTSARGYFEGWIPVPRSQPGFQVMVEVVENDYWFATQPIFPRDSLATSGPQYFAGGDRATVNIGAPAVTSAQPLTRSVGAFVSATTDPGNGTPNVLTDTNGNASDDLEQPIRRLVNETIRTQVAGVLANDLFTFSPAGLTLVNVQAEANGPIEAQTDVSIVDPSTEPALQGIPISNEVPGAYRAVRADISVGADIGLNTSFLGVSCYNQLTARVDSTVKAWAWADATANSTGLNLRLLSTNNSDVNMSLPTASWLNPTCLLSRTLGPLFYGKVDAGIRKGVAGGLTADPDNCPLNLVLTPGTSPYDSRFELTCPNFAGPTQGALGKLLAGLDLNAYLPAVSNLRPLVTNLDNAWCRASAPPPGCTPDQSVLGPKGVQMTADATVLGSLADALGAPLQGRFRNVYAPPLNASLEDVVASQRDIDNQAAGLGLVVDPRQINLALRQLVQGRSTTRTTNGLLDVSNVGLGPLSLTVRPEVAPVMLGLPTPEIVVSPGGTAGPTMPGRRLARFAFPDLRLDVVTTPGTPPIRFSVSATADVGVGFNGGTGQLVPIISNPVVDLQAVGGCQADYTTSYAASYFLCGRAGGGSGFANFGLSATSLTDIVNFFVNDQILPTLTGSIGGLKLPDLTGLLPGLNVALANVRSAQRGGHLAVYADVKPAPRAGIAISEERPADGSRLLRFFPSNLVNLDVQNIATDYAWEIRDAVTNQIVATTQYYALPAGTPANYAVQVPVESLTQATDAFGDYRGVTARLTISQPSTGAVVRAEGTYRWRLPLPPPPSTCPTAPGGFLLARPPGQTQPPLPCIG